MAIVITDEMRAKAEYYTEETICQEKAKELLRGVGLPEGLLPLKDFIECGIIYETGFVWMIQKKKVTHKFETVGRLVSWDTTITAFVEKNRIKKLTGVKTKVLVWVTVNEMYVDDPPTGMITFKAPAGLYKAFPITCFQTEDELKASSVLKELKDSKEVKLGEVLKEMKLDEGPKGAKPHEGVKEVKVDEGFKEVKIDEGPKKVEVDEGLKEVKVDESMKEEDVQA